jgi:multiple sugar transport system ATP-binding protein
VVAGAQRIALDEHTLSQRPALRRYIGRPIVLGIRPEDLEDAALAGGAAQGAHVKGKVELREALGAEIMVHFTADARPAMTEDVKELAEDVGDDRIAEQEIKPLEASLVGRFGARSRVKPGDQIEVAVDTRQLHFFDAESGLGIYGDVGPGSPA